MLSAIARLFRTVRKTKAPRRRALRKLEIELLEDRVVPYAFSLVNSTGLDLSQNTLYVLGYSVASELVLQPSGTPGQLQWGPLPSTVTELGVTNNTTAVSGLSVSGLPSTSGLDVHGTVSGPGIPANTEITAINVFATISQAATASGTNTLTFTNTLTGTSTNGSGVITNLGSAGPNGATGNLAVGLPVTTPVSGTISGILSGNSIQLSQNAAASVYTNVTVAATQSGTTTNGGTLITGLTSTNGLAIGTIVTGTGIVAANPTAHIPPTTITGIFATLTLSNAATATGPALLSFAQNLTGTTNSNTSITGLPSTSGLALGMAVTGTNIPANTTIKSIDSPTSITISNATAVTQADTLTFSQSLPATTGQGSLAVTLGATSPNSIAVGNTVTAAGVIPGSTTVSAIGAQIMISAAATGAGTNALNVSRNNELTIPTGTITSGSAAMTNVGAPALAQASYLRRGEQVDAQAFPVNMAVNKTLSSGTTVTMVGNSTLAGTIQASFSFIGIAGNLASSTSVTSIDTNGLAIGDLVSGPGIPPGTTIFAIPTPATPGNSNGTITLTAAATTTADGVPLTITTPAASGTVSSTANTITSLPAGLAPRLALATNAPQIYSSSAFAGGTTISAITGPTAGPPPTTTSLTTAGNATASGAAFLSFSVPISGTTVAGSQWVTITGLNSTGDIAVGDPISGPGIPVNSTIAAIIPTITISNAATASGANSLTFTDTQGGTVSGFQVTGLTSTSGLGVGAPVTGTGIGVGTTITQINSATSITLSGTSIAAATEAGTTATITTNLPHNLQPNQQVTIAGVGSGYDGGPFTVLATPTVTSFTYTASTSNLPALGAGGAVSSAPGSVPLTFPPPSGTIASYDITQFASFNFDPTVQVNGLNGARIYFFVVPKTWPAVASQPGIVGYPTSPPAFPYSWSAISFGLQQPNNPPNSPNFTSSYPPFAIVEPTIDPNSGGGKLHIDVQTVDGFSFPLTLTLQDINNNQLGQVGQPIPANGIDRADIIAAYQQTFSGSNPYADLLYGSANAINGQYAGILNPGAYLFDSSSASSPLHSIWNTTLNSLFTQITSLNMVGDDNAYYQGKPKPVPGPLTDPNGVVVPGPFNVLEFIGYTDPAMTTTNGNTFYIFDPSTPDPKAPNYKLSAGYQVFANDGVFNDKSENVKVQTTSSLPSGVTYDQVVLGLERDIVSALNRGIALLAPTGPTGRAGGDTSTYWGTETNWYPYTITDTGPSHVQNQFSMFMHTATVGSVPIFTQPANAVKTASETLMSQAYGFAYDENPVHGPANQPDVPSKFDPAPSNTAKVIMTLGPWSFGEGPTVTGLSVISGPTAGGTQVTITGTGFAGAEKVLFGPNLEVLSANFINATNTSITLNSPAAPGPGTVDVRVKTSTGISAINSPADKFTYQGAPTVTGLSVNTGSTSGGTQLTITGTNFTGATHVNFGVGTHVLAADFTAITPTSITLTSPAHAAGTVDVTVTTPSGTSPTSAADQFTYVAGHLGPTVTILSVTSGPTTGGTSVLISGTNFTGATHVKFGETPAANFTVNGPTSITATSPSHAAGTVDVSVTTPHGTSADTSNDQFTYISLVPTVTSLSVNTGPTSGGTSLTITGTNFTGATGVSFSGTPAANFTVNGPTSITVTSPARAAGVVDVIVTTPSGPSATSSADQFTYVAGNLAPTVTLLSVNSGSTLGGTSVTITGTNFTGATAVSFGATPAPNFTVNGPTSITVTSPAHAAGVVDVTVTTPSGGTSPTSSADQFTYVTTVGPASPATSTLSVSAASFVAGQTINVTLQAKDALGQNLTTGGLQVLFALAAGSSGGTLSAVTDNQNGTYTATFTSSVMGTSTFTATLNGDAVTSTASTSVIFQSDFPGTGPLGAPWLKKLGAFTVSANAATAGTAAANLAIYNSGNATASLTASVNVSNIAKGKIAALMASYLSNAVYYRAGIQNVDGKFYALIQRVAPVGGAVLVRKLVTFSGSGTITFEAVGPSLRLYLDGSLVATASSPFFKSGSVGIWGSAGTTFANFSASAVNLQDATLPFSDNFAATPNGQLSTFWTNQRGNFTVQSAQALASSVALNLAIVNGASTATTSVSATVGPLAANRSAALVARYQSVATMYFAGVFNVGTRSFAEIYRIINGVVRRLKSVDLGSSFTGGTVTFNLTGTSLELTVGGTIFSVTDASITALGRVGIRGGAGTQFSAFHASAQVP